MIETIYILRHGFRLNWVTNNWKSPTGLPRDPPLAAFGETQAQEVADYFLALPEDQRPTAIWSSPYYRCIQTAQPVAVALGLPIFIEHGLAEWYSPVAPGTGLHPRPANAAALRAHFPEIDPDAWASVWYPPRAGEDVQQVHARAAGFVSAFVPEVPRRLARNGDGGDGGPARVLLVSHAATVIALARALVGDRALPLRIACCSLTRVERKAGVVDGVQPIEGAWEARFLGDGSHLKDGNQRDWGFEDIEIADGQVVHDSGVPGTVHEVDELVGCQIKELAARM